MIIELAHFALILSLVLALIAAILPFSNRLFSIDLLNSVSRSLAIGQFFFVLLAFLGLVCGFLQDDFSVIYIANQSNSQLPVVYKVSALWGGHEGSLLLWALILNIWAVAVSCFSKQLPKEILGSILAVLSAVNFGFLLFILWLSNPFLRALPMPMADGIDLNPLLQDIGLALHPPILYMGYVGFSVVFAFAISALITGAYEQAWLKWIRPWTLAAWSFLTFGIALGSWWAYYELGWGGWWFWDPVENASLMPWLVATALLHALAVAQKQGVFKNWVLLLAIFTFSLSLLGTFLVRSGVLTSVHAFATDPKRGVYMLVFLLIVVGSSLALYSLRAPKGEKAKTMRFFSLPMFLLFNNLLLSVCAATVLLGTLFPLIVDALGKGRVSVGPPYFNALFLPLMQILSVCLALGLYLQRKENSFLYLLKRIRMSLLLALIIGLLVSLVFQESFYFSVFLSISAAVWIILSVIQTSANRLSPFSWATLSEQSASFWGMQLAHIGFAVVFIAAIMASYYSQQFDLRVAIGQKVKAGDFEVSMQELKTREVDNYVSHYAKIVLYENQHKIATLYPEKRYYLSKSGATSEAAIASELTRDLYVVLGDSLGKGAWTLRLQVKPFISWLWGGAIFMGLGGFMAIVDRRYYRPKKNKSLALKTADSL